MEILSDNFVPFLAGSFIGTCLYAIYIEYGPGMGKIFIRPGSDGKKVFTLAGFFNLAVEPLRNINMWKMENLDINYIFVAMTSGVCGVLTHKILYK